MTILITGATGQVGGMAARLLAASGLSVRALVRDTSTTHDLSGVQIVGGSFEDSASLKLAMEGVDTLFLAGRDSPDTVALLGNVLQQAQKSSIRHVVKLSAIGARPDSTVELMRDHYAVDHMLKASSLGWTLLQPHLYMQNLLRFAESVQHEGKIAAPMADRLFPLVDTRDVGAAAAAVLRNPAAHTGRTYQLTGPKAYSYNDVTTALSAAMQRRIIYEAVAPESFEKKLVESGVPSWRAFDLAHIASAYGPSDCRVSPDFEALVGHDPTPIETFFKDHISVFVN
ncbi:NmrA family NAD(P)-binding protein [Desulfovibrionales bacterium]